MTDKWTDYYFQPVAEQANWLNTPGLDGAAFVGPLVPDAPAAPLYVPNDDGLDAEDGLEAVIVEVEEYLDAAAWDAADREWGRIGLAVDARLQTRLAGLKEGGAS